MRKLLFVGLIVFGTMFAVGGSSTPASAWCWGGYGYARPVYGFAYAPRVWGWGGWRGWGHRGWGYRGWGYRGWGWGGRRWGGWRRW
jgi:hypothetical protein